MLIDPRGAAHFYRPMAQKRTSHPDESQLMFRPSSDARGADLRPKRSVDPFLPKFPGVLSVALGRSCPSLISSVNLELSMRLFRQVAVWSLVCVSLLMADRGLAKTANFIHYTLEVPDDWKQDGTTARVWSGDRSMLIAPGGIITIGPPPTGEDNDAVVATALDEIKKRQPTVINQLELVSDFSTKQIDDGRRLVRRVHRMNPSTIFVQYYIAGSRYIVSFTVTSKRGIDATSAVMEPIFASLKWLGK